MGAVIKNYDYDAFGNELVWNYGDANPFRYSGEYFDDETDLYYLRARYYWPSLGQFTQEDTYRGEPNNPNSLNLYTYCYNDPVQHIDPSGHVAETPLDWISLGSSFVEFVIAPSWTTAGYLVWDVIAVAAPGAPGSYIAKGIGKYDDAVDIVRGLGKADDVVDVSTTALSGRWKAVNESMSEFSRRYQQKITGKTGVAWVQNGVKFDGIKNGILLDAKGKYSQFINKRTGTFYDWFSGKRGLIDQARRQIGASDGAEIQWFFAERESRDAVRNLFAEYGITGIELIFEEMR